MQYEEVHLKLDSAQKALLAKAAEIQHLSLDDFILSNVCQNAEEIINEQVDIRLKEEDWVELNKRLDSPPEENPGLKKLFSKPSVVKSHQAFIKNGK